MKLYVASSWRNELYADVLAKLRAAGHECYDFKNPYPGSHGFAWSAIDPEWKAWDTNDLIGALNGDIATKGFLNDFEAMNWADGCVLVMPCGRSAHLEAGWFAGAGKPCWAYVPQQSEPELMYLLLAGIDDSIDSLCGTIARHRVGQLRRAA